MPNFASDMFLRDMGNPPVGDVGRQSVGGNPLRSRLPFAATIPSATPFSMLRFVGPII
jgi:hypothetical protein